MALLPLHENHAGVGVEVHEDHAGDRRELSQNPTAPLCVLPLQGSVGASDSSCPEPSI